MNERSPLNACRFRSAFAPLAAMWIVCAFAVAPTEAQFEGTPRSELQRERPLNDREFGATLHQAQPGEIQQVAAVGEIPGSLKLLLTMSVLSLAPALLMMTTCFVRFSIVTGLLRQAIGLPNVPSQQIVSALCLFLTFLVMAPVWQAAYDAGIEPYLNPDPAAPRLTEMQAFERAMVPVRDFMGGQIEQTGNQEIVWMFHDYHSAGRGIDGSEPASYQELPLPVLLPAYLVSELKTAFLIGVQIFLPFLVIDLVVASVLAGSGLLMVPPVMVSLPFKLLLFVLIDGWFLIVGMLLESVRPFG